MAVKDGVKTRANSGMSKQQIEFKAEKLPSFQATQELDAVRRLIYVHIMPDACQLGTKAEVRWRISPSWTTEAISVPSRA